MEFKHFETRLEKESEYPKLVRDGIPELVAKQTGKEVKTKILENDEEYLKFLLRKIGEEAHELANASDKEHMAEEIADIREILDSISELKKISAEDVQRIQKEKAEKRGGFKKRILMLEEV